MKTDYKSQITQIKLDISDRVPWTKKWPLEGCSEDEIREMMRSQHVDRLPALYVEFMLQMGRVSGVINREEYAYPFVLSFKKPALELLAFWGNDDLLPSDAFVFINSMDAGFHYFLTSTREDDPEIYFLWEDDGIEHVKHTDIFSEWLKKKVKSLIESHTKLK